LNLTTWLALRSTEPDRVGVADEVDLVLVAPVVGIDLARVRVGGLVAFESVRVRADGDLVALVVRVVLVRVRADAGLPAFVAGVDLAAVVPEADLAGVGFGFELPAVGADVGVDGVLPASVPVGVGADVGSVGALSAPVFAGDESAGEVPRMGVVAMEVLLLAGGWRCRGLADRYVVARRYVAPRFGRDSPSSPPCRGISWISQAEASR